MCRHFAPPSYGNIEAVFISTGFRNWKNANGKDGKFAKHHDSQCHKISTSCSIDYPQNLHSGTSVKQIVDSNYLESVRRNRHYIRTIGEIILLRDYYILLKFDYGELLLNQVKFEIQ